MRRETRNKRPSGGRAPARYGALLLLACLTAIAARAHLLYAEEQPGATATEDNGKICLDDICFEREIVSGDRRLSFRGIGHATFFTFHLYTAAFYADPQHATVAQVLDQSPKWLVIEYRHGFSKDDIVKYSAAQLKANPAVDFDAIRERFEKLCSHMQDVRKGDRYEIVYKPETGTELLFNGKSKVVIPGKDFAKAYFGIWLSEYPINAGLRRHLLRGVREEKEGRVD